MFEKTEKKKKEKKNRCFNTKRRKNFISSFSVVCFVLLFAGMGIAGASVTYDPGINTIFLESGTNTLVSIYNEINEPSVLSYDSGTNTYTLSASISGRDGDLVLESATLVINSASADEAQIITRSDLTIRDMTIKPRSSSYTWKIWGSSSVGAGYSVTILDSDISGGHIYVCPNGYQDPTTPTVIKNNYFHDYTSTNGNEGMLALRYNAPINAYIYNNIFENIHLTGGQYNGILSLNSYSGCVVDKIYFYDCSVNSYGVIYFAGPATYDNPAAITNFEIKDCTSGILGKEFGSVSYSNGVMKNIENVAGRALNTYQSYGTGSRVALSGVSIDGAYMGLQHLSKKTELDLYDVKISGTTIGIQFNDGVKPAYLTNSLITDSSYKDYWFLYDGEAREYQLADIYVADENGNPVESATVTIDAVAPDVSDPFINRKLESITQTETLSNGHTPLPKEDESKTVALLSRLVTRSTDKTYAYCINAEKDGHTATVTVNPDESWYREDPNTYPGVGGGTLNMVLPITGEIYTISGAVTDTEGTAIENAEVSDGTRLATTDENGCYTISCVPADTYTVTCTKEGYQEVSEEGVVVSGGATTGADFVLVDNISSYTSGHNPAKDAAGVSRDTNMVVHMKDDGVGVDQLSIVMTVEGTQVTSTITGTANEYTLTYTPPTPFDYDQVVDITIAAHDLAGNVMPPDSYSFTIESEEQTGDLIGYWKFDEGEGGTAGDSSGNSNDGTIHGATWVDGKIGKALEFDGSGDYVGAMSFDNINAMTIEMWIYAEDLADGSEQLAGNYDNDDDDSGFALYWYNNKLEFAINDGSNKQASVPFTETRSWTHVAGVAPGAGNGAVRIYVNGVETTGKSQTGTITDSLDNLILGANADGSSRYFEGKIDEVMVYNKALSAAEIREEYEAGSVNHPPIAFIDSITPGTAEQGKDTVAFSGHGTDPDVSVVAYNWSSSIDGSLSSASSFSKPASELSTGTHTVYFKVQDDKGAWSTEVTEELTITSEPENRPPVADLKGPYTGTEGAEIVYDGSNSYDPDGSIVAYEWDFGDETTATGVAPTHTYAQDGTYTVTLTVTDNDDETNMSTTTATIADTKPTADFTATPTSGEEPLTVAFTDNTASYAGIVTWDWDFDNDGETDSTEQNPTHVYAEDGVYSVCLTVTESDGDTDTLTSVDYITVTALATLVAEWHFDEGEGGTAGDSSGNSNDGTIHGATWVDGKIGKALEFDGSGDYVGAMSFDNINAMTIEMWIYAEDLADGSEQLAGNYDNDDDDSGFALYWYNNKLEFAINDGSNKQASVPFTETRSWTHVAGVAPGAGNGAVRIYVNGVETTGKSQTGTITDSLDNLILGANADGSSRYFEGKIDEVMVYNKALSAAEIREEYEAGSVNHPPIAFIDSITPGTAEQGKDTVAFSGHGTDPDVSVVAYNWSSSIDGSLSSASSFSKPASELSTGTHTVYFKVQDDKGAWSTEVTEELTITSEPENRPPVADLKGPYTGTEGAEIVYDGSNSYDPDGSIVAYEWDFGDETTATGVAPTHTYAQDGTYTVTLTVTDNDDETNMSTTTATIADTKPTADFTATPTSGEEPLTVAFTDNTASYAGIVTWDWDFDNDGETDSTEQNPTHVYAEDGVYSVCLTVTESDGDTDTLTSVDYITVAALATLVAEWHFDEGEGGTAGDSSGNSNDGTIHGATWVDGKIGKALEFDGSGDYVGAMSFDNINAMTIEMWIYAEDLADGSEQLAGNYDNDDDDSGFALYWYNNKLEFAINDGSNKQASVPFTETRSWTHVAGVAPGAGNGAVRIYVNGVETTGKSQTGTITDSLDNLILGANADGSSRYFEGKIDEVMVYNKALSAAEIREEYEAGSVNHPPIAFIDSITPGTAEQGKDTVAFSGHGTDPDVSVVAYNWSSSIDGSLSSASSFSKPASELSTGTHTVYFKVQDDKGAWSTEVTEELTITSEPENRPPVADLKGPYTGTEGIAIAYDGSGSYDDDGNIVAYDWDFGDGDTATGVAPTHTYTDNGTYTVTLTVTDNNGATNTSTTKATIADTEPTADFSAAPTSGLEPLTVTFTDNSTSHDGIVTWNWDFDNDGETDSTEQNPTYEYAEDGVYTVNLKVTESDGDSETKTKVEYITVIKVNAPLVSNPAGPYTGTEGAEVVYDGSNSYDPDGSIVAYEWDFGDETTGNGVAPTHTYTQDGTYSVALTVTDNDDATSTSTTTATIADTEPTADFSASPTSKQEPLTVTFTDNSASYDGIVTWDWDFDNDGETDSTEQNPTHAYAEEGVYTVSLTVTESDEDSDTMTKDGYITVTKVNEPPEADPSGPYIGTEGAEIVYDGSNSYDPDGTIVAYEWDFGDETTATGVAPTHTYAQSGTYTVALTVTDNDDETNMSTTTATIADTKPTADFTATPTSKQEPLTVTFTDNTTSSDGIETWNWDFDSDGAIDSTVQNPTQVYAEDGIYTVSLTVTESDEDSDTMTKVGYITVTKVNEPPVADPSGPYTGTEGAEIVYDGSNSYDHDPEGSIVAYEWDFGDGNTATGVAPTHTYAQNGAYTVTLTVTDDEGATVMDTTTTTIADTEPTADFSAARTHGPEPLTVTFTDNSASYDGIETWSWDFDNDGVADSTEQNPTHVYIKYGRYTVSLTVTESDGDSGTMTKADYITVIIGKVSDPYRPDRVSPSGGATDVPVDED